MKKRKALRKLQTMRPVSRFNNPFIRRYFPKEASKHPGKMKVALIAELISLHRGLGDSLVIADPMTGVGSTGVAAAMIGADFFFGCELSARRKILHREWHSKTFWGERLECGHSKLRKKRKGQKFPAKAICKECGVLQVVEIREELIIVAEKK